MTQIYYINLSIVEYLRSKDGEFESSLQWIHWLQHMTESNGKSYRLRREYSMQQKQKDQIPQIVYPLSQTFKRKFPITSSLFNKWLITIMQLKVLPDAAIRKSLIRDSEVRSEHVTKSWLQPYPERDAWSSTLSCTVHKQCLSLSQMRNILAKDIHKQNLSIDKSQID